MAASYLYAMAPRNRDSRRCVMTASGKKQRFERLGHVWRGCRREARLGRMAGYSNNCKIQTAEPKLLAFQASAERFGARYIPKPGSESLSNFDDASSDLCAVLFRPAEIQWLSARHPLTLQDKIGKKGLFCMHSAWNGPLLSCISFPTREHVLLMGTVQNSPA